MKYRDIIKIGGKQYVCDLELSYIPHHAHLVDNRIILIDNKTTSLGEIEGEFVTLPSFPKGAYHLRGETIDADFGGVESFEYMGREFQIDSLFVGVHGGGLVVFESVSDDV